MKPTDGFDRPLPALAIAIICLPLALIAADILYPAPPLVVETMALQPPGEEPTP